MYSKHAKSYKVHNPSKHFPIHNLDKKFLYVGLKIADRTH